MMTFKELKKLVKLPLYKEQRVPTVKALEESGVSVVAEKILENHGSISVYQNGYVIYRAHKRVTVFSLRNCVHYKYDALEGAGHHIEEEEFDEYEWHIRLVLEGEDRIFMNYEIIQGKWMPSREDREYREEILEGVDEAVSTLERMISEERVEELLSTLTDTETKKAELFAKVRSGQVRILLGSTPKLGAGTNIQDRLIVLHHLDCPWKPSDLEQQEGRILRQGNRNQKVKIFRYVTENTFDSYMRQILENKQKFISQIMTSKSPVRACDDVDDTALTYAEIKALATGNPYIKEKMDLDIQVSKLKLLKANHTSQIYSLESDIARRYPREIAVAQGQIEALKTDMEAAKPLLAQDKDHFSMEISGKVYTERKEAGAAIIEACKALKAAGTEGRNGSYGAFELHSRFDNFDKVFRLSIKGAWNYSMEVGKDPQGNILRVTNALAGIERALPQVERRLETLEQQLAQAKEEAKRPFAQEAELAEKSARLAELNSLLNMDEKGSEDALGVDEDAAETEVADRPRQPVNYAGRVAERTADNVRKPSVLAQLHVKQAERSAEPQKSQKRKSHDMEL